MMSLVMSITPALAFIICLFAGKPTLAQNVRETTHVKRDGPTIVVRTVVPVEVLKVEPYIDAKQGKKSGNLSLHVVIKNTAHEPRAYQLFGQGKTDTGGWLGGATKAPSKGRLDPGKEATTKVRTSFEGESVPDEIRLDIF
jgi:hypothetical protein